MNSSKEHTLHRKDISAVKIGEFDLGNGCFTDTYAAGLQVRSVVVHVDEQQGLAYGICPVHKMMCWSPVCFELCTAQIASGKEATRVLLETAAAREIELPAVKFCAEYHGFGVEKGEAFLPSIAEIQFIKSGQSRVIPAWRQVSRANFWWQALFSSSVNEEFGVWVESFSPTAVSGWQHQCRTNGVIPMVEIKF